MFIEINFYFSLRSTSVNVHKIGLNNKNFKVKY